MARSQTQFHVPNFFRDLSLRTKIISVIAVTSLIVVTLAILLSFLMELNFFRDRLEKEHRTTARIIASNLEVPFAFAPFADSTDAEETLGALSRQPSVVHAAAFLQDGTMLAQYRRSGVEFAREISIHTQERFDWQGMVVVEPVVIDGETLGRVVIVSELSEFYAFIFGRAWAFLALMGIALGLALFLAAKMGKLVSKPILDLAETAQQISADQDFSRRHARVFNDETGRLVDAFNAMMAQIESHGEIVRANAERFQRYFELGVVGMGILDASMRWHEANDRMSEILGYSLDELKDLKWNGFLSGEQSEADEEGLLAVLSGRRDRFSGECWLEGCGNRRIFAMVSLRRVEPTRAHPLHYIILVQDITERKVSEENLLAAKEEAEASNHAKDEFLSIMSHELRTPLNPIIGFGQILHEEIVDATHRSHLDIMMRSAQHLLELIDNILNYIRFEHKAFLGSGADIDYKEILEESISFFAAVAKEKDLQLYAVHSEEGCLEQSDEPIRIDIEGTLLRQVALNLLGNAIKFSDRGSIKLESRLRCLDEHAALLRVEVQDSGVGIPEHSLARIFEAFTQLDESLTRSQGGIGLGLAICRKIVDALGGDIGVTSQVGVGSTFWVELEVKYKRAPKRELPPESPALPEKAEGRILLVEDDINNQIVAETVLRRSGVLVKCVANGSEAVDLYRKEAFDLVLMDLQMNQMNGYDATRKIREMEEGRNRHIPIVGITAHVGVETEAACRDAGMDDYLAKPYKASDLESMLHKWLPGGAAFR